MEMITRVTQQVSAAGTSTSIEILEDNTYRLMDIVELCHD